MSRCVPSLLVLLLFAAADLRREGAQILLWGQMIVESRAETSWMEAMESTLSGNAPCSGCLKLTRAHFASSADAFDAPAPSVRGYWSLPPGTVRILPAFGIPESFSGFVLIYESPHFQPDLPPPKKRLLI